MLRIAITSPEIRDHEPATVAAILDAGWHRVHLRHPGATLTDMRRLIEHIPQRLHQRLRLHGHFELLNEFNLGGIQLNHRCPCPPKTYAGPHSRSCHSVDEAVEAAKECDYVTLSPIFDSISKQGYLSAFTPAQLQGIPPGKTIALGGITPRHVAVLKQYPFAGYAVLGYLFNAPEAELAARLKQFDQQQ